ncbi:MAG TPA: class F sortase [Dehalococcoidia bacterium]|nr:class F sortase [Dehalococcoidia bacterium]
MRRKGALPIAGGFAVIAAIGVLFVSLASGGNGSGVTGPDHPDDGASGGLAASTPLATPEATIDLNKPTPVATRDPNAPMPGASSGDRLIIAKFGVNAPLTYKVVGPDGVMPNPNGPDDVAFYDFKNHEGLGGVPGFGNVVLAGHVDSGRVACKNGTVPPPCQAVFWDIGKFRVGDEIELVVAGRSYKYRVTSNESVHAASGDWTRIVSSTAQETITLITCGGDFNPVTREYSHRQVVTGVRI